MRSFMGHDEKQPSDYQRPSGSISYPMVPVPPSYGCGGAPQHHSTMYDYPSSGCHCCNPMNMARSHSVPSLPNMFRGGMAPHSSTSSGICDPAASYAGNGRTLSDPGVTSMRSSHAASHHLVHSHQFPVSFSDHQSSVHNLHAHSSYPALPTRARPMMAQLRHDIEGNQLGNQMMPSSSYMSHEVPAPPRSSQFSVGQMTNNFTSLTTDARMSPQSHDMQSYRAHNSQQPPIAFHQTMPSGGAHRNYFSARAPPVPVAPAAAPTAPMNPMNAMNPMNTMTPMSTMSTMSAIPRLPPLPTQRDRKDVVPFRSSLSEPLKFETSSSILSNIRAATTPLSISMDGVAQMNQHPLTVSPPAANPLSPISPSSNQTSASGQSSHSMHAVSCLPNFAATSSSSSLASARSASMSMSSASSGSIRRFRCDMPGCGKQFKHKSNLKIHQIIHTDAALKCSFCEKKFARKSNLRQHLRVHTDERPYQCEHCKRRFKQTHSLKDHIRTHTGERPYKCEFCPKAFKVKHNLVAHRRLHTGERPFECEVCPKAFASKSSLNGHCKKVHPQYFNKLPDKATGMSKPSQQ